MWKHTWKKLKETETLYEVRLESPVLGSKRLGRWRTKRSRNPSLGSDTSLVWDCWNGRRTGSALPGDYPYQAFVEEDHRIVSTCNER